MKSMKPTIEQMEEFFAQVKAGRITKDNFQKFIFNPSIEANINGDGYIVTVDRTLSLAKAIEAGKYNSKNGNITDEHYPLIGEPKKSKATLFLAHLNKNASDAEVDAYLAERGLRDADIRELLAFGAKYPKMQLEFPIIARGSVWRDS
ncbi:MAG: hypothetical protein V1928_03310, partial [Parcubacteria group bacterium]